MGIQIVLFFQLILFVAAIGGAIATIRERKMMTCVFTIIVAFATFGIGILVEINLPEPVIERKSDYSNIVLSAEPGLKIEYKISSNESDEWIEYKKPFNLNRKAIVTARTKLWFYKSKPQNRDVYVAENGLVYFGSADEPVDSFKEIEAKYLYREMEGENSGNHYVGYQIKKEDIYVTGIDLENNEKEINNFTFSPQVLKENNNDIEVQYKLNDDKIIVTHITISADEPKLIKLNAKYVSGRMFTGTELSVSDFDVNGVYEDGTQRKETEYSILCNDIKVGNNEVTISKDGISVKLELNAVTKGSIVAKEKEPNDEIYSANEIESNINYIGKLGNESDLDYYRIQIDKKGRILLKIKHSKIDSDSIFWRVELLGVDEEQQVKMDVTGAESEKTSSAVRVMPGTYYVKVAGYYYSNEEYTLTVEFEEEDDKYETEPNNDLTSQAMQIETNKEYVGNLTSEQDEDYFQFVLKEKSKVCIKFSHAKTNTSNILWEIALLGDSDGQLTVIKSLGETSNMVSDYVRLPAGNYYVRIKPCYWSDIDYKFSVISENEKGKTENECNDDYGTATRISMGDVIKGNIQSESDIDFYSIQLKKKTNVKLTFTHNKINDGDMLWKIELYSTDSDDSIMNTIEQSAVYVTGNDAENISSMWKSLPAGLYYIKVRPYYYNNSDYELKINYY